MKNIYILDTSVYLTDANAIYSFGSGDIVIPFTVLEEVDKNKNRQDGAGFNARSTIRILDELRKKGSLYKGVRLGKGKGIIRVQNFVPGILPEDLDVNLNDNKIISVAYNLFQKNKFEGIKQKVIIVTKDVNMRIKADSLDLLSEDYLEDQALNKKDSLYTGFKVCLVDDQIIDRFYSGEQIFLEKEEIRLYPNQFVMLVSSDNEKKTALARFINYTLPIKKINDFKDGIWSIKPKNKEQMFSLDLLMDPKVPVVTLTGKAGSGKSLLAIASGLEQTLSKKSLYRRFVVIRPVMPLGRDIGFLPGSIQEKLEPWIMAIVDNLRFLFGNDKAILDEYIKNGVIEIEALTFIRGRSISNAFILVDEVQNLSSHELKTILTRVGEGTKIVLTGDLEQIDSVYLNEMTSGLTNVVEKFKDQDVSGHVSLVKGERSIVATISSKIL